MQIFMHTRERNEITMVWALFNAGTDYYNKTNKYVHTHTGEHIDTHGIGVQQGVQVFVFMAKSC